MPLECRGARGKSEGRGKGMRKGKARNFLKRKGKKLGIPGRKGGSYRSAAEGGRKQRQRPSF